MLLTCAFMTLVLMIIADLQRTNRVLVEEALERIKLVQYGTPNHSLVGVGETVPTSTGPIATGWSEEQQRAYDPATDGEVVDQWAAAAGREGAPRTQGA